MSKYTFTFKKDDIFVEFTTTDKDVVENQFQIWVADADDYMRNPHRSSSKNTTKHTPAPVQSQAPTEEKTPIVEAPQSVRSEVQEAPQETAEVQQQEFTQPSQEQATEQQEPEVFDKASTLLKTINTIQNPETAPLEEEPKADFGAVLDKEIQNPTFEPTKPKDQVYLNLVTSKKTTDKFHYLIITSYYLSEFEKMERFSLKQINTKLMQNLSTVIDHAMLQEAINQGLIELVPDLTGTSEAGEYTITHLGEEFFANKI